MDSNPGSSRTHHRGEYTPTTSFRRNIPGLGLGKLKREKLGGNGSERGFNLINGKRNKCPIYMPRSEDNLLKNKDLELIELIGEGSYAKVYLCKKKVPIKEGSIVKTQDFVLALKIIDVSKASTDYVKKFLPRELSVLVKINHPNIIKLYMLFQRKSKYYMCMRFAERGDLLEYILGHGQITENRAKFWSSQIAKAIEYLHTMNIVHRDIKTENILITEMFNVKLCDFGFSRFVSSDAFSSTFCGSISYSPPEVLQTRSYDAKKADMWSFGIVIFVMLLKRLPFKETENPKLLLAEQLQKSYIMPPKMEKNLTIEAKKALKHLLEPFPKKRWGIKELFTSPWFTSDIRLGQMSAAEMDALKRAENFIIHHSKEKMENIRKARLKKRKIKQQRRNKMQLLKEDKINKSLAILTKIEDDNGKTVKNKIQPSKDNSLEKDELSRKNDVKREVQ